MNFFTFDLRKVIVVFLLIAIPFITISLKPSKDSWLYAPFYFALSLTETGYVNFSSSVKGTTAHYLNLLNVKKHNRELIEENNQLKAQLALMNEVQIEIQQLKEFFEFQQQSEMKLLAAHLISHDIIPDHATIRIDRGSNAGIQKGMAVITTQGVVGYIFKVDVMSSHVLLLSDRYSIIDAMVQRTRARGLIEGKSKDTCDLRYLERLEDANVGDLVVTSGLDPLFPKGFPIGTITSVEKKKYEASLRVQIQPLIDPNKIETVFVVLNANTNMQNEAPTGGK